MRPLQWIICQLHGNELPLRHLIEELDGETDGPEAFSGEIGKSLKDCTKFPTVAFKSIACELPEISKKDLGADQRYLFDMCNAISSGNWAIVQKVCRNEIQAECVIPDG